MCDRPRLFASFGGIFFGYDSGYINGVVSRAVNEAVKIVMRMRQDTKVIETASYRCGTGCGHEGKRKDKLVTSVPADEEGEEEAGEEEAGEEEAGEEEAGEEEAGEEEASKEGDAGKIPYKVRWVGVRSQYPSNLQDSAGKGNPKEAHEAEQERPQNILAAIHELRILLREINLSDTRRSSALLDGEKDVMPALVNRVYQVRGDGGGGGDKVASGDVAAGTDTAVTTAYSDAFDDHDSEVIVLGSCAPASEGQSKANLAALWKEMHEAGVLVSVHRPTNWGVAAVGSHSSSVPRPGAWSATPHTSGRSITYFGDASPGKGPPSLAAPHRTNCRTATTWSSQTMASDVPCNAHSTYRESRTRTADTSGCGGGAGEKERRAFELFTDKEQSLCVITALIM
ncbi:hypothetical protein LTR65_006215 [Meristemomyces frigidus]